MSSREFGVLFAIQRNGALFKALRPVRAVAYGTQAWGGPRRSVWGGWHKGVNARRKMTFPDPHVACHPSPEGGELVPLKFRSELTSSGFCESTRASRPGSALLAK